MFNNANKFPLWSLKLAVKLTGRPTGVSEGLKNDISDLGCIFIHIPKCAGNAVQKSLFGEVVFGHQTIRQYQLALGSSEYRKAWKFAITRDPFERIVSAWRFLKAGGLHAHDEKYYSCTRFVSSIQDAMGITKENKFANLNTVIEGYDEPILIETPWSKSRGF